MGEILLLKVLILFSFSIDSIFNFMSGKSSQTTEACLCFRPCGALSHRAMPYVNAIAPLGLTKKRGTDHQESLAAGKRCCHDRHPSLVASLCCAVVMPFPDSGIQTE